jgi:hypothetical protein
MNRKNTEHGFAHLLLVAIVVVAVGGVSTASIYAIKAHNTSVKNQQQTAKAQALAKQQAAARAEALTKAKSEKATPAAPSTNSTPAPCTPDTTMYVTSSVGLYLRSDASFSSSQVILMPYASAVQTGCLANGWYKATYGGKTGYASQTYVSASKPAVAANPSPTTPSTPSSPAPSAPTTITIGHSTYDCSPDPNNHWQSLVYTSKNPTSSYSSPNGAALNSYAQWSNITGLSCASTSGWLVRGSEYFWAGDLAIT